MCVPPLRAADFIYPRAGEENKMVSEPVWVAAFVGSSVGRPDCSGLRLRMRKRFGKLRIIWSVMTIKSSVSSVSFECWISSGSYILLFFERYCFCEPGLPPLYASSSSTGRAHRHVRERDDLTCSLSSSTIVFLLNAAGRLHRYWCSQTSFAAVRAGGCSTLDRPGRALGWAAAQTNGLKETQSYIYICVV